MTIHLGWWALPAAITLATLVWFFVPRRSDYYGYDIVGALGVLLCIIADLTAWLIWAVLS